MVNIPLELQSPSGGRKPVQRVNPGEVVSWVPSNVEVKFINFKPADGKSKGPPDNNPFDQNPPGLTDNTVKQDATFGDYFYEIRFNGILVGEGTIPVPRIPP